jgi:hypothetical protein
MARKRTARQAAASRRNLIKARAKRRRRIGAAVTTAGGLAVTAGYLTGRRGRASAAAHKTTRPAANGPSAFTPKPVQLALPAGTSARKRPKPYGGHNPLRAIFHASNRYVMPGQIKVNLDTKKRYPQSPYPRRKTVMVGKKSGGFRRVKVDVIRVSNDFNRTTTVVRRNRPRRKTPYQAGK